MTKVNFYQIESEEPMLDFACRLVERIHGLGHQIHVHTRDAEQASMLDDLLWTFRADAFLPHALAGSDENVPVKIGHGEQETEPEEHHEVLINLSGQVPDFFSRFARVAEVVPRDENHREQARANYRFYKERGYELDYHKVSS